LQQAHGRSEIPKPNYTDRPSLAASGFLFGLACKPCPFSAGLFGVGDKRPPELHPIVWGKQRIRSPGFTKDPYAAGLIPGSGKCWEQVGVAPQVPQAGLGWYRKALANRPVRQGQTDLNLDKHHGPYSP
jgi:hypothetical protein